MNEIYIWRITEMPHRVMPFHSSRCMQVLLKAKNVTKK